MEINVTTFGHFANKLSVAAEDNANRLHGGFASLIKVLLKCSAFIPDT